MRVSRHSNQDKVLLFIAATLGVMSLLLSWLNPLAALLATVAFGVAYVVSALIPRDRKAGSPEKALRTYRMDEFSNQREKEEKRELWSKILKPFAS